MALWLNRLLLKMSKDKIERYKDNECTEKEDGGFLGPWPPVKGVTGMMTKWPHKHFVIPSLVTSTVTSPRNITFLSSRYHLRMAQWKISIEIKRLTVTQNRPEEMARSYAVKLKVSIPLC